MTPRKEGKQMKTEIGEQVPKQVVHRVNLQIIG
jgi:hypothetical protein